MSPVRYGLGRGCGEGAPAELLPAPGATLQTHAGTRLDGAFYRLHHHLSSSPPHSWGGSSLPALLMPDPPHLACPTGRSALRHGCETQWAPAPLRLEGGSYLCLLTPPLAPVHSLAVILALLLPLGNHAAAETLSVLGTSAFTLRTSTCSRPRRPVLAGTACWAGVPPWPRATRQRPPREGATSLR